MQLGIGVQTLNVIDDECPEKGAQLLKEAGFSSVDFSLHGYLTNKSIYGSNINHFFEQTVSEMEAFFTPHKEALAKVGIDVWQMHMPYPVYVPKGSRQLNTYLRKNMAPKSLRLCKFLGCKYIVIHGFKLAYYLGSEEQEWQATQEFLEELAPLARELGITMCIENLYDGIADRIVEGPCCDAVKAVKRIDAMNEKYGAEVLGFCFDTGHGNLIHLDFEEFITTLGSRLKVLHIHDNDGWRDLHQIPFAFTKTRENKSATDWEGFVRGVKKIEYKGVLNFETGPALTAFPDELKREVLAFIAKIGTYFVGQIDNYQSNVIQNPC